MSDSPGGPPDSWPPRGPAPQGAPNHEPATFTPGGAAPTTAGVPAGAGYWSPAVLQPSAHLSTGASGAAQPRPRQPTRKYRIGAYTPLWWFLAWIGLAVLANILVLPGNANVAALPDDATYEQARNAVEPAWVVGVALGAVSGICGLVWVLRIGRNTGTYTGWPFLGMMLGYTVSAMLLFLWPPLTLIGLFIVLVWPFRRFINALWAGGGFSHDAALLGWLPIVVAAGVTMVAAAMSRESPDTAGLLFLLAVGLVFLSGFSISIAMLVVTIVQHTGISQDRRNDAAYRLQAP